MKYFSMFSGIGGFELGIKRAYSNKQPSQVEQDRQGRNGNLNETGGNVLSPSRPTPLCIGFSEVNKYAIQIYRKHFDHKNYGDATRIIPEELPDFDFLCGGFPCQAFSIAGKRGGFKDTRGTLFFEIARILSVKRPKLLLLENVKGLLSHDRGRTFGTILATLSELGYLCEWQVLNSKDFGVPQNRERVFIVGHLGGEGGGEIFPITEGEIFFDTQDDREPENGERIRGEISSTIDSRYGALRNSGETYVDDKPTRQPLRFLTRNQKNIEGDYSFTVDSTNTSGIKQGMRIRRLTPTECERLQGFPDGWTSDLSDSQRYKCLGNAVTTNVITAIMERIL